MINSPIRIMSGLPFVSVIVHANGQTLRLERVLLDTGSAGTVLKADHLITVGVIPLPTDRLRFVQGVGDDEVVIEKSIDGLQIGEFTAAPFTIQMGAVEYGIPMDGIVGLDFLIRANAILDFKSFHVHTELSS